MKGGERCKAMAAVIVAAVVMSAGCSGSGQAPVPTPVPTATAAQPAPIPTPTPTVAKPTPTPVPTATVAQPAPIPTPTSTVAKPTPTPVPTATVAPTPVQIFSEVSPSIAFIETLAGTGSGVLIEGGYVVTSAHVVWPFDTARVVFPDGSEFLDAPVKGWDLMADVAVIGPVDASQAPLELSDGRVRVIGSDTFLIGYPGEVEAFPQPAFTRGLVSRTRRSDATGLSYLQTDSAIAGGQSGGALVSNQGEVIGISGFGFTEADFALAAVSADIASRVQKIIAGEDPSGLGDRRVPLVGGSERHEITLGNYWDQRAYVIADTRSGDAAEIRVAGVNDTGFFVYDSYGFELLYVDDKITGEESGIVTVEYDDPPFLVVEQLSEEPGDFTVASDHRLVAIGDADDGRRLRVGRHMRGNIDFPGDVDHYFVTLREGETVEVTAKSDLADVFLTVDYEGAADDQIIVDDNSGGGLFGLDSKIVYRAPHTGSFFVVVSEAFYAAPGGYVVKVGRAGPGSRLTSTTRASIHEAFGEVGGGAGATSGFGLPELRAAFDGLPASFEELDPDEAGLSVVEAGLGNWVITDAALFASSEPFQMIYAVSGNLTNLERIGLDAELRVPQTALDIFRQDLELDDSRLLDMPTIGDRSVGVRIVSTYDGVEIQTDIIIFRRGNVAVIVYSYFLPYSVPSVSSEGAARMVDAAIVSYLAGR